MKARAIHLHHSFEEGSQHGAEVRNPLFDLLKAVRDKGSIQHGARALGASYRHVWGALKHWQAALGEPLVTWTQGQPARLTPFAERLLWAEVRARARLVPHIEALRAELEGVLEEATNGSVPTLGLSASHDFALPLLREHAAGLLRLQQRRADSIDALRALAEGRCQIASLHLAPAADGDDAFARSVKEMLESGRHRLVAWTRRSQGLMVAPGNPLAIGAPADLRRPEVRFVQRQAGSATRRLADALLGRAGVDANALRIVALEHGHLAAAAAVASGLGDVGVGVAAAAAEFGLDFIALVEEDGFLVCHESTLESEALARLRELLAAPAWASALARLPGYRAWRSGEMLAPAQALRRLARAGAVKASR